MGVSESACVVRRAYVVDGPALQRDHQVKVLRVDEAVAHALRIALELALVAIGRARKTLEGDDCREHAHHAQEELAAHLLEGLPLVGGTRCLLAGLGLLGLALLAEGGHLLR